MADNIDWKGLFVSARWIDELSSPVASHASNGTPEGWPWGNYTTPELDRLAAAVAEFWARWDGAHNTAPKNDAVIAWLKERGMSENIARAVASLIRSPDVPPGPRRTSKTGAGATSAQRR